MKDYELIASHLLRYAVNGERGRPESDPVYQKITEGRDVGTMQDKYSSCGDLAHWLYRVLGVRAPWLNRNDDNDGAPWKVGVNINWLSPPPIGKNPIAQPRIMSDPTPGDVILIHTKSGGHCMCVVSCDPTGKLVTAEYGQPGGKLKRYAHWNRLDAFSHMRLSRVIRYASEAGKLVDVDFSPLKDWDTGGELSGGMLDDLAAAQK